MRTTLSLDDDVAAALRDLQRRSGASWKDVVNSTYRAGLAGRAGGDDARRKVPHTSSVRLGTPLVPDISNVHEVLSLVESDARR